MDSCLPEFIVLVAEFSLSCLIYDAGGTSLDIFVVQIVAIASLKNDATTSIEPSLILHTSEDEYELYINGKFYKTLTEDDITSGNYSNYELIEGIE